jgi:hypothetical protein
MNLRLASDFHTALNLQHQSRMVDSTTTKHTILLLALAEINPILERRHSPF